MNYPLACFGILVQQPLDRLSPDNGFRYDIGGILSLNVEVADLLRCDHHLLI